MAVSLGFGIVISGFMVLFVTPWVAALIEDVRRLVRALDPNPNPPQRRSKPPESNSTINKGV